MKKLVVFGLILLTCVSLFAQGAKKELPAPVSGTVSVNVAALRGPTAMGMVKLMEDAENNNGVVNGNKYNFALEGAPDAIVPLLAKGEVDIACIPANLASIIYNNTNKIEVLGINTLGVLYIVQNGGQQIRSVDALKGMTIFSAGKGSTPEYALDAVLQANGLTEGVDVFIEWKSEHTECVQALVASGSGSKTVAMLPQPFATSAMNGNPNITICLDLNFQWQEWAGTPLVTGVVVARKEFIENHPEALKSFLSEYKKSVEFVTGNTKDAASLIEKFGILNAAVAEKALPYCNIVLITGNEMLDAMTEYLSVLCKFNPNSVGGKLPDAGFYYKK